MRLVCRSFLAVLMAKGTPDSAENYDLSW